MPDSSGAAKENWGEKSESDENERTPQVEPKSTNPRQEDKKARRSHMLHRWFYLSNFWPTVLSVVPLARCVVCLSVCNVNCIVVKRYVLAKK